MTEKYSSEDYENFKRTLTRFSKDKGLVVRSNSEGEMTFAKNPLTTYHEELFALHEEVEGMLKKSIIMNLE